MKNILSTLSSSFLAGLFISMGGLVFLKLGGIAGAVLFSFGLLSVVHYRLSLFTGTAGFFDSARIGEWWRLLLIWFGNCIGCFTVAYTMSFVFPELADVAMSILDKRLALGKFPCFLLAIFCGIVMTTAVEFARKKQFLPLLFGVPLFILCGFTHSIADAFYFLYCPAEAIFNGKVLTLYAFEVLGNLAGCNLYRLIIRKQS
ncbi:MAG: formate/nitrite transporter family protein [Lepagella sp.]